MRGPDAEERRVQNRKGIESQGTPDVLEARRTRLLDGVGFITPERSCRSKEGSVKNQRPDGEESRQSSVPAVFHGPSYRRWTRQAMAGVNLLSERVTLCTY